MNLLEQINAAQGSRGRLEAIFLKLAASSEARPDALAPLAQALLACGAFAQVLDLAELADLFLVEARGEASSQSSDFQAVSDH